MKVYLELPQPSRGLQRVYDALVRFLPSCVEVVMDERAADLVIVHVIGRNDQVRKRCDRIRAAGQRYAIIQYVLRSSMRPHTSAWLDIWCNALAVWSYYDLPQACAVDGESAGFGFYHAPLGCDSAVFNSVGWPSFPRSYLVGVLSQSWLTEGAREVAAAAGEVGGRCWHVGPVFSRVDVISNENISDMHLADRYALSRFVACLRRVEGFEQPAVEALFCGARPILFDTAGYRQWFGDWAEYIPEGSREQVIVSLVELFEKGARSVTADERAAAVQRFHWPTIINGFWERALA